jgi:hypothetical protein
MTAENVGYGQLTPQDTTEQHNVLRFIIAQMLGTIATVRVVKVVAVHPGEGDPPAMGTVDVQPLVKMLDGNNNATEHGTVHGIPVVRLAAGSNAIVLEPVVGDIGVMLVCDRDISAVKENKAASIPGSFRKFNLADGLYLGGILGAAPERYFQFKSDGNFKLADAAGNVLETGPTGFVLTGNVLLKGNLSFDPTFGVSGTVNGNLTVNGTIAGTAVVQGSINLGTHRHLGVTVGAGTSGTPTP